MTDRGDRIKLFYQSAASLGTNPVWDSYEKALSGHLFSVKGPETEIELRGVRVMIPQATEYAPLEYLNVSQILDNAIGAEKEGYDGFVLGCMTDLGHDVLTSVLDIPAVFAGETSMHLACLFGKKFALVARTERAAERIFANIKDYGFQERALPPAFLDFSFEALSRSFQDPGPVLDPFFKKCDELIASYDRIVRFYRAIAKVMRDAKGDEFLRGIAESEALRQKCRKIEDELHTHWYTHDAAA